jgi:3-hydroxyacyl-CoA dehydrogenase/enoyl-CoA hydratase/3-hydroxybutyryl-CoA epimerase
LVNRVLFPYLLDAAELFEAGFDAEKIDNALVKWGLPMGPLRLIDEIGVDITLDIAATLEKTYGKRAAAAEILRKMQSAKMLGRKTGGGFYKYEGKQQTPNESINEWRKSQSANADVDPAAASALAGEGLANRLVFLMVNEAARCVEEKVVESPEDADYGMILGTGFAPFRGGPLRFAEHFGLKKLVDEMNGLAQIDDKFQPCEILKKHADEGTKFYES